MMNSAGPDQPASSEANWSGSTLFAKIGHVVFSKKRVNTLIIFSSVAIWALTSQDESIDSDQFVTYPAVFNFLDTSTGRIIELFKV